MTSSQVLRIDRIACDGHGMCAELLPEMIELDEWGYPVLRTPDVSGRLLRHARRAVAACPVLALRLESAPKAGAGQPKAATGDHHQRPGTP